MPIEFNPNAGAETSITVRFPDLNGKVSTETPRFSIGYWSIRGLGAPLRMMLSAAKVDHIVLLHDLVEKDEAGSWKSAYFQFKPDIVKDYSNPFMNLPYLIDRKEEIVLCQTNAIFNYLGRELRMCGSTVVHAAKCDELLCEEYDLRNLVVAFSYGSNGTKEEAEDLVKNCSKHLAKFNAHLGLQQTPCHLVDGKATAPDFHLFEMIDQLDGLCKEYELEDPLKDYPNARSFKVAFENLSENSFYLKQSTLHTDLPYNNCMAKFASALGAKCYKCEKDAKWRSKGSITITCGASV